MHQELGETGLDTRGQRDVQRGDDYDMDDLAQDMESDAVKPWERMGMTPGEYMQFKNSGLTLQTWNELSAGRRFQAGLPGCVSAVRQVIYPNMPAGRGAHARTRCDDG